MRKLLIGLVALTIISQIPQASNQFKEGQHDLAAAYEKAVMIYNTASQTYDKTQSDIRVIKTRLDKTKEDIDKNVAYAKKENSKISGFFRTLTSLLDSNRNTTDTPKDGKKTIW